ncbi:Ig-like domain repeat protein [Streptomyces sioyaensis]
MPLVGGTATTSFNPLSKGSHVVAAQYNGDVSFAASTGSTVQSVP